MYLSGSLNGGTSETAEIVPLSYRARRSGAVSMLLVIFEKFMPNHVLPVNSPTWTRFLPYQSTTTSTGTAAAASTLRQSLRRNKHQREHQAAAARRDGRDSRSSASNAAHANNKSASRNRPCHGRAMPEQRGEQQQNRQRVGVEQPVFVQGAGRAGNVDGGQD